MMSNIRDRNTKPELLLRKHLHSLGVRFRLNQKIHGIKPDLVLKKYQTCIQKMGYWPHPSGTVNHLRDTEDKYGREGHAFSLNKEIMYTYDVCGNCEAHAMMYSINNGLAVDVENSLFLHELRKKTDLTGNVDFTNCP